MFYLSVVVVVGFLASSPAALAADLFKCADGGKVTWQDHPCELAARTSAPPPESPAKAALPSTRPRELKKSELHDPPRPADEELQAKNARRQHAARMEKCRALQDQVERERKADYSVSPTVRKNAVLQVEQLLRQARELGC